MLLTKRGTVRMTRQERRERDERLAECQKKAREIVTGGKCPECGSGLHANSAIPGWWQCDRFGAPEFRRDLTGPQCNFQCFTE